MKKEKLKQLDLGKIKIAQLNHLKEIKGGFNPDTETITSTLLDNCTGTDSKEDCMLTHTSTKTIPISNTANCI
ncbi:hypothetical protein [Aquimarina litoralis]|uniref:hypothetical protein n=1 Tax=Aquimarina litoralis TaxID=584605 RepID=UPI001C592937|nr:hypothetical protein [Aquimarina litoralis]MBW1298268.1 hypothetical protein [Aquimarina litoralis]